MELDIVVETLNQDDDNHENDEVQKSKMSDNNSTTGKSLNAKGSKTSFNSATSLEFANEKSFDELDGDLPLHKPSIASNHSVNATDNHVGCHNRRKLNDKERDKKSDLKYKDTYEHALSERFDGLELEENSAMLKGRNSFPMDMRSPFVNKEVIVLNVHSVGKGKHSTSDRSNAAALKSFVARRRTMSPSVSSTSLESLCRSFSGEKLSLGPEAARRNASSPALKSLEASFEETDKSMNRMLVRNKKKSETSVEALGVFDFPAKISATTSADAVKENETKSPESNQSNSSAVRTTHSSRQKSFSTQPVGLNLDLNLDVEEEQACKRVSYV